MKGKLIIHIDTNEVTFFKEDTLEILEKITIYFNETTINFEMLKKIDEVVKRANHYIETNNENTRLYVTGRFQKLSNAEKVQIITYVYVKHGLFFNIIEPDLEEFYIKKSGLEMGSKSNILPSIKKQEFRKVVICGSFQNSMDELSMIREKMIEKNIEVLSPWTEKIVPHTANTDFILLEGQELYNERDAWRHKYDHMKKFEEADAIIICNPGGRVGQGTIFEFGWMTFLNKRIIFLEAPDNLSIQFPFEIGLNFM